MLDEHPSRVRRSDRSVAAHTVPIDCSAADAVRLIDERFGRLGCETIPVLSAVGRRLAEEVVAVGSVPGFVRAAMDGYAVRSRDTAAAADGIDVALEVIGESLPGDPFRTPIAQNQCVAIATGAQVPQGADAVIRLEFVDGESNRIRLNRSVTAGQDISAVDEDVSMGSVIAAPPRTLRPQDPATFASAGVHELQVFRQPRVALLATGAELLPAGTSAAPGHIVDTNSIVLRHLITRDGGTHSDVPGEFGRIVTDDFDVIRAAMAELAEKADVVLVSGGTSFGRGDHAVSALADLGSVLFRGVRIRPGGPAAIGAVGAVPVCLLPGNPVACMVVYDLLGRRIVRNLGGYLPDWPYLTRQARLSHPIRSIAGRVDLVRVRFIDFESVEQILRKGASNLSSTVRADGFLLVPEETAHYEAGAGVEIHLYESAGRYPL